MITQITLSDSESRWNTIASKNSAEVPFVTWRWHINWNNIFGLPYEPLYLLIDDAVIAPFVKKDYSVIFSGGEEIADYLDIIGPDKEKPKAWTQIIRYLRQHNIKSLSLRNVPQHSPTVEYFKKYRQSIIQKEDTTPTETLPHSWDTYVEAIHSPKHRHELERKVRKFEREHAPLRIYQSEHPDRDIRILLELMEKNEKKRTFLTPSMEQFFRETASAFEKNISLLLLSVGDIYVAATLSFVYGNAYYLYNSGFDKATYPNAGFYLKAMSIRHAIEHGYTTYNFLQGNERYKYELGGNDSFVYSITLPLT